MATFDDSFGYSCRVYCGRCSPDKKYSYKKTGSFGSRNEINLVVCGENGFKHKGCPFDEAFLTQISTIICSIQNR